MTMSQADIAQIKPALESRGYALQRVGNWKNRISYWRPCAVYDHLGNQVYQDAEGAKFVMIDDKASGMRRLFRLLKGGQYAEELIPRRMKKVYRYEEHRNMLSDPYHMALYMTRGFLLHNPDAQDSARTTHPGVIRLEQRATAQSLAAHLAQKETLDVLAAASDENDGLLDESPASAETTPDQAPVEGASDPLGNDEVLFDPATALIPRPPTPDLSGPRPLAPRSEAATPTAVAEAVVLPSPPPAGPAVFRVPCVQCDHVSEHTERKNAHHNYSMHRSRAHGPKAKVARPKKVN